MTDRRAVLGVLVTVIIAVPCAGCGRAAPMPNGELVEIGLDSAAEPAGTSVTVSGLSDDTIAALRDARLEPDQWASLLRVVVDDHAGEPDETPAVLGDYEMEPDGVVRFRPMFPFQPGLEYRVTFDLATLDHDDPSPPATALVSIPRPELEPTTIVTRLFPSGDRLPENQLKLYLEFSAPMSHVDGLEYIRLLDDRGNQVQDPFLPLGAEFWDYDYRRYTVFFDPGRVKQGILPNEQLGRPLTTGQSYTLVVDATWPDADGVGLKHEFRKEITVGLADTTPIDPGTWRLRVPSAGTTQRLVVSFAEPLDYRLLVRSLGVENGSGQPVAGSTETTSWETRWSFSPEQPWTAGHYALVALSNLEDLAGNRIGTPFEIDVFQRIDDPTDQESYRVPFEIDEP